MMSVIRPLRLFAFSVAAVALCACARLGTGETAGFGPGPRFADAPGDESRPAAAAVETLDTLQARLDRLEAEQADALRAIAIMHPKPRNEDFIVPAGVLDASPYAPPPELIGARSVFAKAESCATSLPTPSVCDPAGSSVP